MRFALVDNIECVLKHAWSLRFGAVALLFDCGAAATSFFAGTEVNPWTLVYMNSGCTIAAAVTRCVKQDKVSGADATGGQA